MYSPPYCFKAQKLVFVTFIPPSYYSLSCETSPNIRTIFIPSNYRFHNVLFLNAASNAVFFHAIPLRHSRNLHRHNIRRSGDGRRAVGRNIFRWSCHHRGIQHGRIQSFDPRRIRILHRLSLGRRTGTSRRPFYEWKKIFA